MSFRGPQALLDTYDDGWQLSQRAGLRSFVTDWRRAPPLHETIKSGLSTGAGIAAELRGDPKR